MGVFISTEEQYQETVERGYYLPGTIAFAGPQDKYTQDIFQEEVKEEKKQPIERPKRICKRN